MTNTAPIEFLEMSRGELADIHRGKHFAQWRLGTVQRLDGLATSPRFRAYAATRMFTGDGDGLIASTRFSNWAVDRLVAGATPRPPSSGSAGKARR